ncbi:MAG: metallophosphatase family protein [Clostridia bacterium]|nr:metallophosphatase family protein [Clostridia bacterium]
MIYITGDTHIPVDVQKLSTKRFPEQKKMTKDDYIVICGDFGGVWDGSNEEKYWIKWLKNKNFTTLFIDGNHENFEMLYNLPTVEFCGGIAHKVEDGIYHLIRGEVYSIDGNKFFVFGGASSHDKEYRTEGKNWWAAEMPSEQDYKNAEENLRKNNFNFDFIITHSAPTSVQKEVAPRYEVNKITEFLEEVKKNIACRKWFFGHYHRDIVIDEKFTALFDKILEV